MIDKLRKLNPPFEKTILKVIFILHISLAVTFSGLWVTAAVRNLLWRADFTMFYTGWSMVSQGLGSNLYDYNQQSQIQQTILSGNSFKDGLLPFDYPPHVALIFSPLGWLPIPAAYTFWSLGQIGILIWLLFQVNQLTDGWQREERWMIFSSILALAPLMKTLMLGSFSLLLLVCTLQVYQIVKKERSSSTSFWLLLGTLKPQAVIFLGAFVLGVRRWRDIVITAVAGLIIFIASSVILGFHIWIDFFKQILEISSYYNYMGFYPTEMYNLRAVLVGLFGADHLALINAISLVLFGLSLVLIVMLWRGSSKPNHPDFELRFALTAGLGVFFSPHVYAQDSLILLVPILLFYAYLRQKSHYPVASSAFLLAWPLMLFASQFFIGDRFGFPLPNVFILILLLWMAKEFFGHRQTLLYETLA